MTSVTVALGLRHRACPVVCLLTLCGPATVIWRVVAVVVDTVKAMVGRGTASHVNKEIFKALCPAIAYRDAATLVTMPSGVRRFLATSPHLNPRPELRGPYSASRVAVRERGLAGALALKATAAQRASVPEGFSQSDNAAPAVTPTGPGDPTVLVRPAIVDREPAYPGPGHVYQFHQCQR